MPRCLTLSNIKYVSRIKWSNPGKGVVPSPTPQCSSYWKGSLLVTLDYGRQLYLLIRSAFNKFPDFGIYWFSVLFAWIYIYIYIRGCSKSFQTFLYRHLKFLYRHLNCTGIYEMTDQFSWFQRQMNSYTSNWNTPYWSLIVTAGEFQKCNLDVRTLYKNNMQWNSVLNLEKMPQKRMECFWLLFDYLAWIEHQFLSGIRDSRKAGSLWGVMRGVGGVRKS